MKNTPSMAKILPKNSPCATGLAPNALLRWSMLPPSIIQTPKSAGRVARMASVKKRDMTVGGERGSALKM